MDAIQFERLKRALRWAADERLQDKVRWDQDQWFVGIANGLSSNPNYRLVKVDCGSSCCIAGNVVINEGAKPVIRDESWMEGNEVMVTLCQTKSGRFEYIFEYATKLLGLTPIESDRLFECGQDIDEVVGVAIEIAADHGFVLNPEDIRPTVHA